VRRLGSGISPKKSTIKGRTSEDRMSTYSSSSLASSSTLSNNSFPGLTGHIRLSILSASNIIACDPTGFSDPYCVIKIGRLGKLEKVILFIYIFNYSIQFN